MMKQVQARIHELGLERSVRMLGVRNDISSLYQALDVLAFPSTYEGLGMVSIEAQASGLPVIASNYVPREASIIPGLVKFFPLDKTDAWAVELAEMSPVAKRSDEKNAICHAGYDIKDSAQQLGEWYSQLVDSSVIHS